MKINNILNKFFNIIIILFANLFVISLNSSNLKSITNIEKKYFLDTSFLWLVKPSILTF